MTYMGRPLPFFHQVHGTRFYFHFFSWLLLGFFSLIIHAIGGPKESVKLHTHSVDNNGINVVVVVVVVVSWSPSCRICYNIQAGLISSHSMCNSEGFGFDLPAHSLTNSHEWLMVYAQSARFFRLAIIIYNSPPSVAK